ncbi:MAG TPA: XdhC family protein, partial [Desulfosarcina sp.]|nr:XdhC family protein [Desulfosarcina sp.]
AQKACGLLESGETFILATIVSHSGSTPRTAGSQMIVTADGRGFGTLGGGLLEARVMSRAAALIRSERSAVMPFDLSFQTVDTMDMICGGQAEVLLDCVRPTEVNASVFNAWRATLDNRQPGWMLTVVAGRGEAVDRVDHCLLTTDGAMIGDGVLSEGQKGRIAEAVAASSGIVTLELDAMWVVAVPAQRICTARLYGAGHVALFTARAAAMVSFRVAVADDREEYANAERFPEAHEIRVLERFEQAFADDPAGSDDYVVILTRGHLHDKTVLAQALRTDAGYIGMIGSRRKRDAIYQALLEEGFSQAAIDRVHSPIGLSIGAETPEEIAVSIVAEMIRHRAGEPKADS